MSTSAIIMMAIAITVVWGGLALAVILLLRGRAPGDAHIHRDL
jgi:hypothetical protein